MFIEYLTLNGLSLNKDNITLIAFIFSLITNNKIINMTAWYLMKGDYSLMVKQEALNFKSSVQIRVSLLCLAMLFCNKHNIFCVNDKITLSCSLGIRKDFSFTCTSPPYLQITLSQDLKPYFQILLSFRVLHRSFRVFNRSFCYLWSFTHHLATEFEPIFPDYFVTAFEAVFPDHFVTVFEAVFQDRFVTFLQSLNPHF